MAVMLNATRWLSCAKRQVGSSLPGEDCGARLHPLSEGFRYTWDDDLFVKRFHSSIHASSLTFMDDRRASVLLGTFSCYSFPRFFCLWAVATSGR